MVHDLSYQQARHFNLPVRGVYVANPGYSLAAAGMPRGALITAVNSQPVANSIDFSAQLAQLGDGDRATVRYTTIDDPNGTQLQVGAHGPALVPGAVLPSRRRHGPVALRPLCRPVRRRGQ